MRFLDTALAATCAALVLAYMRRLVGLRGSIRRLDDLRWHRRLGVIIAATAAAGDLV